MAAAGKKFVKTNWGLLLRQETTPNTYIAPTHKMCLEKGKGSIGQPEYTKYSCDQMSAYDGDKFDIVTDSDSGKIVVDLDIAMSLAGKTGEAGLVDLFLGGGMQGTMAAGFRPETASPNRLSLLVSQLRRQFKIKGAIANTKIIMKAGEMVRVQSKITGTLAGDVIELPSASPDNVIPKLKLQPADIAWVKAACGIVIGGKTFWVSSAELDFGLTFKTDPDYCGKVTRITGRQTKLTVTIKNTEMNETPISDLKNATPYSIVIKLQDNNGNDKYEIDIPAATTSEDSYSDNEGYLETTRTFIAVSVAGDDNFLIKKL